MAKTSPNSDLPRELGFRMPAEWEPHDATWLAWPHNRTDWPGKFSAIPFVYCEIVQHLARHEQVHIIVQDEREEERTRALLARANALRDSVVFHRWPTNRVWTRDFGPIFVTRSETGASGRIAGRGRPAPHEPARAGAPPDIALLNFAFTAWAKYPDWELDDQIPQRVARELKLREWRPEAEAGGRAHRVVLEGGSIDVNGAGMMLTTNECLLSSDKQCRNPALGRAEMERVFRDYLGVEKTIWLNRGIAGDDTHGHVDDIARFVAPEIVVAAVEHNLADPNYEPLKENIRQLRRETSVAGRKLRVVALPMPRPIVFRGQRLPASYANFYIANNVVLVPVFNDPRDRDALNTLADVFPGREIVPIYCGDFIWGLGAIHCATQQQPKAIIS